jgi:hypothetical protein
MQAINNAGLAEIATQIRSKLQQVIDRL